MTSEKTVQQLASEAAACFEWSCRGDDTYYAAVRDGSPPWVRNLVYAAHAGMLPDDWRYAAIASAVERIARSDDPQDAWAEWADSQVDTYNHERIAWLASHGSRAAYCDEAVAEDFATESLGIIERFGLGQYMEANEVYGLVLAFLERMEDR